MNIQMSWPADAACTDTLRDYFVEPGDVIRPDHQELCRRCPVRRECLEHAYDRGISHGYFAGLSPSQRSSMTKEQALELIQRDELLPRT